MEKSRPAKDFYKWMSSKNKELSSSPEARTFARSGSQLPRKFYDEIFPLAIFVEIEYPDESEVVVQPHLGNDNFDASIISHEKTYYIEITYAKDGHDDSLRDEVLEKEGRVALTGPVTATGRRGTDSRSVTATMEAVNRGEQTKVYIQLIGNTISKKANKVYGKNHILLVAIQDHLALAEDSSWRMFDENVEEWLQNSELDFGRVVFVGVTNRFFRSYELPLTEI